MFTDVPILALVLGAVSPAPGLAQRADSRRAAVIRDIHGNLEGLTGILRQAGVTDASNRWTAGNSIVVQTGDHAERGAAHRRHLSVQKGGEDAR